MKYQKFRYKVIKKIISRLLLILFGILIFLLFAEILCRLFFDDNLFKPNKNVNAIFLQKEFPQQVYINKSNGLFYKIIDNSLSNWYLRFNYKNTSLKKDDKTIRVAILGDSFTMGGGFKVSQLGDMLNNEANTSKFEILPFADNGINSYQEYFILRDLVLDYNPDLIILQFTTNDNDSINSPYLTNNNVISYINSKTNFFLTNNKVIPYLPIIPKKINQFLLSNSNFFRFISFKINILSTNRKSDVMDCFLSIRKMNKLIESKDIKFVIINMPLAYRDYQCGIPLNYQLKELTIELNITYINICDYANLSSIKSEYEPLSSGGHYSIKGYELVSKVMKDYILDISKSNNNFIIPANIYK